ncbi:MAG: thiamine-phosphate kinase [Hyphomicrobiales bacterium]|nr:thiamine-phosphate kinase [Hyphomicrobiales bacterium]
MDEKLIIKKYFSPLSHPVDSFGLSDDVAQINVKNNSQVVFNQDSLVAGTHFFSSDDPKHIAKKSIRVNVSDVISKGVIPYGYFLSIALDKTINENWIKRFCRGLSEDQKKYNIKLLGGDTVSSENGLFITINMISKSSHEVIKRSTAITGNSIYVSGFIGDSAIGLSLIKNKSLQEHLSEKHINYLLMKYHLPDPKFNIVGLLRSFASSSMDTTDGLFHDLKTLSQTSGVNFHIDKNKIPYSRAAGAFLKHNNNFDLAYFGGDDYQTIFTANKKNHSNIIEFAKKIKVKITQIGFVGDKQRKPILFDENNERISNSINTFKHFK